MKKFTTLALAGAMVLAMGCTAMADETITGSFGPGNTTNDGAGKDLINAGDYTTATITFDFTDTWGGGGVGHSSIAKGAWDQFDYSNEKELSYTLDLTDIQAGEDGSKTFEVQCWWVGDNAYSYSIVLSGAAEAPAETPEEPEAPATADVAPIAFLASVVAVAGIAMVASKKRA